MDFFEHQHQAKKKTRWLVFYFVLAIILIVTVINTITYQLGNSTGQFQLSLQEWFHSPLFLAVTIGTLVVIALGSLVRSLQISGGGQSVAKMVDARAIAMNSTDKLERRLINVVEEMSIASGMSVPSLFIMDGEMGMNAFVAGLVPSDTVLVVTQGLLENLNRQELQGVVAHEFSHIFNADMRLNVRLIGILGGILALGQLGYFMLRSMRFGGYRRSSSSKNNQMGLVIVGAAIALLVVGYIGLFFGRLIKAAISRQREFLADASAVQYSRDAMGIANALYRIKTNGKGSLLDSSHAEDMSHMCFGSALKFSAFSSLLATHPPIDERITKLVPGYRSIHNSADQSVSDDSNSVVSGFSNHQAVDPQVSPNISSAQQLIGQIGQLNPEQLSQAKVMHQNIPEQLLNAAHDAEQADLLILAIITAGSDGSMEKVLQPVSQRLNTEQINCLKDYAVVVKQLSGKLILPLVEMAMPALKQSNEQQKSNLLACSSLLISVDNKIVPFEFFLYALLRKNLTRKDAAFNNATFRHYKPVLGDIQFLLSLLSEASGQKEPETVALAMKSFDHNWQIPELLPTYNASQLNQSLNRLNKLSPLLKKPLMQTFAEMVLHDGVVNTTELELLRATSIYLECPIAPLVTT